MKLWRPKRLNTLILAGFGLVGLPLVVAVIWGMLNLDRLAEQSETLVFTGVAAGENNRLLAEHVESLERSARQYLVLGSADMEQLLREDLTTVRARLRVMAPLARKAGAEGIAESIGTSAGRVVADLIAPGSDDAAGQAAISAFPEMRRQVTALTTTLSSYVDTELKNMQDNAREAQRISAWQVAGLLPATLVFVIFFIVLVAKPIREIDSAINQLGQGGFSKPIAVSGPTDLRQLGQQLDWLRLRLLELAQEKNRFLRHMSHELKTPLANIREGTELLLDGTVGELDAPQREVADILRTNGLKLQQLIENLLSFSAWQTRSEILTLADFPVRQLVTSVARAQRLALKSANIQLKLDVDDITVNADREKIRTVLDNLLSNAIKFTPKGGYVTIRAREEHSNFVLELGDTGPGISADESPRIYEAFFQGHRKQGGQVAGTGIGLSVVLECVQAHNGTVQLVDSDEFPGAHFRIEIPQKRVASRPRLVASG